MKKICRVRSGRKEDILHIINLLKQTDLFWELGDREETFRQKLDHDPDSIIVLELGDKIIGMCLTIYDPWASFIWHVAVDPPYQGHGLGHLLADEAESRLRKRGTTSVNGYILPSNTRSAAFFVKRGYQKMESPIFAIEKAL